MKNLDDWYNIINQNIIEYGGGGILIEYEGSISKMLKSIYPNHNVKYLFNFIFNFNLLF